MCTEINHQGENDRSFSDGTTAASPGLRTARRLLNVQSMHRVGHVMSWITALVIAVSPTVFADEPRPDPPNQQKAAETKKPHQRKLKGRDVAMLLWMPFTVFGMDLDPHTDDKVKIKKTEAEKDQP
jgi:hypothetical protein